MFIRQWRDRKAASRLTMHFASTQAQLHEKPQLPSKKPVSRRIFQYQECPDMASTIELAHQLGL